LKAWVYGLFAFHGRIFSHFAYVQHQKLTVQQGLLEKRPLKMKLRPKLLSPRHLHTN